MKKIIIISTLFFFAIVPHVFAAGFTALAPIPGLTDTGTTAVVNSTTLATFFNNLYKYLVGAAAILAVIEITWGGIEYSTQDSISKKSDGKGRITQAILGLILVLSPVLVFSIINPSILNLSLNLPKLDTVSGTTPAGAGSGTPAASNVSGCTTVSGPAQLTVVATCTAPDLNTAQSETQSFISKNCSGNANHGAVFPGSCPNNTTQNTTTSTGGSVTAVCTQATAIAYCSPIVNASIIQIQKSQAVAQAGVRITYTNLGYFGSSASFASSCTGSNWSLTRTSGGQPALVGAVLVQAEGTPTPCPTSDPSYQQLIKGQPAGITYECATTPVYCRYQP